MENAKHYTFAPPLREYCPICAVKHEKDTAHCETSVYYLIKTRWGKIKPQEAAENKKWQTVYLAGQRSANWLRGKRLAYTDIIQDIFG